MRCIISPHTDPYLNLASEEVLLKHRCGDFFVLYRNSPSIVVGKHQNTLAEINLPYVEAHGITVARRISGGGTVYHDMGNLNFAFITSGEEGALVDYKKYTRPVIGALEKLGVTARLGKRNELLLGKTKISGTASHVYKQRVLHHGTLLFSSEMEHLSKALKVKKGAFTDRAVRSVRAKVTNLGNHLPVKMNILEFQEHILNYVLSVTKGSEEYTYRKKDLDDFAELKASKFSTWEWNFGYSPKYEFVKSVRFEGGELQIQMNVEKGTIREVHFEGDFLGIRAIEGLQDALAGTIHDPETLRSKLSTIHVAEYISGLDNEHFLSGLF